jgi:hypothetical protein
VNGAAPAHLARTLSISVKILIKKASARDHIAF